MIFLFSQRIKELREIRGINQVQLAEALQITKQTVSAWEKGLQETDFAMLIKIANFFNVSIDYLLGND